MLAGGDQPTRAALDAAWPDWSVADLVIGVDGGARAAAALGLALDLIVGDFDTLRADEVDAFEAQGIRVLRSPHDKDATDTELALLAACDAGAVRVEILGALGASGGRSDHSLGTIALLAHPRARAVDCSLLDATSRIRLLTAPAQFASDTAAGAVVSLIPWGGDALVSTERLRWPLQRERLHEGSTRGLSNESLGAPFIEVHEGALLISEGPGPRI
ncbi:MAG: thiamine diphosphokinase [Candidatus Limnocylindrus sp.]